MSKSTATVLSLYAAHNTYCFLYFIIFFTFNYYLFEPLLIAYSDYLIMMCVCVCVNHSKTIKVHNWKLTYILFKRYFVCVLSYSFSIYRFASIRNEQFSFLLFDQTKISSNKFTICFCLNRISSGAQILN